MRCQVLTLLCLYGVGLALVRADFLSVCPQSCKCKWSSGLRLAECSNADFTTIPNFHPSGSDQTVQVLIMDGNYIKELPKNIFYSAGLSDVQKISLKNCQIEKIHGDAFSKLNILKEIYLEGNQISKIEPKTFDGNNRLEKIVLSRNNIPVLREYQFPHLKSLKKLDLSNTGLEEVRNKAFNYIKNIEEIDFSGNRLTMLDQRTFLPLTKLKSLNLKDNHWNCDCELKSFREHTKNIVTSPPKCSKPERLAGKSWNSFSSLQFACKPDIKIQSEMVYAESGWNITLSCHITGNPVPSMRWVLGGRVIHGNSTRVNQPGQQYHIEDRALGPGGIERNFSLTINNVQWGDQGDYNCVAMNQGGMAEKNIALTFSHPTTWADISDPSSLQFILAIAGSFLLFIILVIIFCCVCRRGRNKKKKNLAEDENLKSSYCDPAGEKLLPNTSRFEDGEGMSLTNSADSYNMSSSTAAYPDLIQTRMTALSPGGESYYSTGSGGPHPHHTAHLLPPLGGAGAGPHLPPLPPVPGHLPQHHAMQQHIQQQQPPQHHSHSQEFLNPVHLMPVQLPRLHHLHHGGHDPTPAPFQRTATLPHNYTIAAAGTLPHPHHHNNHHPRSVSYDHSNGPAARPGYVTLPRRPRASVAGYGGREPGQNTAPSPAFSYGGEQGGARDPIYDGVGPRTSADGSSKLSLNHSQGDGGTPRGHLSTGSRPPGSISYALPPPIDEAPEIRPKPKQDPSDVPLSTATSQQTLLDGLEENLAAYDEPWGKALPPTLQAAESSHSSSTLEDTAKLNQDTKDHEDPVMCSTPKSLGDDSSSSGVGGGAIISGVGVVGVVGGVAPLASPPAPPPPSGAASSSLVVPPKTKPKTWKKPSVPPKYSAGENSQQKQPLLLGGVADGSQNPNNNHPLSVNTAHSPPLSSTDVSPRQLLSPGTESVTSSVQSADESPRGGGGAMSPPSDNVPIWQKERKVGKIRPQPPPKPKISLNSGGHVQAQNNKDADSSANSFQDETNDGSEV
eukprot:TRINITY_DN15496_c0_g3_i1.p1 TRINITY_DN15496_c0_g3~~TRINITY_DN15496_c0_g3_i1.p1  ORF type:complete len:1012 (+),score=235.31 TRINITY_DN15496_c0_g3_i1:132-3167(+)